MLHGIVVVIVRKEIGQSHHLYIYIECSTATGMQASIKLRKITF